MSKIDLNGLRDQAYKIACDHGFHDKELSNEHWLCLVISELMEAVEADRKEKRFDFSNNDFDNYCRILDKKGFLKAFEDCIKDTIADELADASIRLLDLAGLRNIDLNGMVKNTEESITTMMESCKHETFTETIYTISVLPARLADLCEFNSLVSGMLFSIIGFSRYLEFDIFWHIEQKMKYNELREKLHGKKY